MGDPPLHKVWHVGIKELEDEVQGSSDKTDELVEDLYKANVLVRRRRRWMRR